MKCLEARAGWSVILGRVVAGGLDKLGEFLIEVRSCIVDSVCSGTKRVSKIQNPRLGRVFA